MPTPYRGFMYTERRSAVAFWGGAFVVAVGVVLHLPMYWMGRDMGFRLAGMPMDPEMYVGMAFIVLGIIAAGYGLLPNAAVDAQHHAPETLAPPEDAPLTRAHWLVMAALAMGLIIDIMKPASLGFVTPGMRLEYNVGKAMVAFLPLSALAGTTFGSFAWGMLADIYGRRASIMLSAVMFIGTSICGAMPSFWWNVFMCFMMGAAAGGMLPVAYALLAELMPTKHRGWCLVLIGGIGAVGGYFAASGLSAVLLPYFGWRIMWFLNLPTGLLLIALSPFLPESARFLMHVGRTAEARAILERFGAVRQIAPMTEEESGDKHTPVPPVERAYLGSTVALTLAALAWGLVNFGVLLWLPSALVAEHISVGAASSIIARSALLSAPVVLACVWLYSRWSTKWSLVLMLAIMTSGLVALLLRETGFSPVSNPLLPVTLLVLGSSGVISILLPYTAETYPIRVRGRATGWIAGCSKLGGLLAQGLSVLALVPALGYAALFVALPAAASILLIGWLGHETRGRDLRELEHPVKDVSWSGT
ncbi:MAG TPA: MFS transporter [Rhizomicrobium sp.]|jgi:putative MFS transporter